MTILFLCQRQIFTPDYTRAVKSYVLCSVQMSSKLHDAFDKTQCLTGKDFFYRLRVTESDVGIIEIVLQFAYTGNIVLPHDTPLDIMRVLLCSQELGFDAAKVAGCLGAMLALTDSRLVFMLQHVGLLTEHNYHHCNSAFNFSSALVSSHQCRLCQYFQKIFHLSVLLWLT